MDPCRIPVVPVIVLRRRSPVEHFHRDVIFSSHARCERHTVSAVLRTPCCERHAASYLAPSVGNANIASKTSKCVCASQLTPNLRQAYAKLTPSLRQTRYNAFVLLTSHIGFSYINSHPPRRFPRFRISQKQHNCFRQRLRRRVATKQ